MTIFVNLLLNEQESTKMSDKNRLSFYKRQYAEYSDKLRANNKNQKFYVVLRLATFILLIFAPLIFINDIPVLAGLLFVLLFSLFLYFVKKFNSIEKKGRYLSCLIEINQNEIEAIRGNFSSFDDGRDYIDTGHPFSYDLDIFGPDSLFNVMNRCVTPKGKDTLAEMLLHPSVQPAVIRRRQKAFSELGEKQEFCQHFIATGKMYMEEHEDRFQLLRFVNSPSRFTRNRGVVFASGILPLLTIGALGLVLAGILPFYGFTVLFLFQLVLTGLLNKRINEIHSLVTRRLSSLKKYGKLLNIIQDNDFNAPMLKSVQRYLRSEGMSPSDHIKKLSNIVNAFDNRLNIIAAVLLNGLFLWDINCVLFLERWNRKHRKNLPVWLDSVARMDAYTSFGVFTFNNPGFAFPCPLAEGPVIEAVCLGHPLIPEKERVCNDLIIEDDGRFVIITGANMAGKSTFLRTAGMALIMAMAGAPVCAGEFRFRIMEVWSSMRTNDSLSRNESYFYAELKRLKNLIERIANGARVFVLLDEILKGTNNTDKQKGSVALLEQMLKMGATGIVATHDLLLTELENNFQGRIINKCFDVEIAEEKIYFDYILRDGVTSQMNAMVLMKQMGLLRISTSFA